MASPVIQNNFRARKTFAKIAKIIDIPNLIDIQKQSYEKFLQKDVPLDKREDVGLQGVFKSVFPIKDFSETSSLEFVSLHPRQAQVRRRRVPPARHDVRRADQGDRAPGRLGHQRGDRVAVDPRRQGAGGLLRRDPADDGQRDVHHQRHRARRRQPAAPQPGRLLRSRQGQDALVGQAALQRPHHPLPRLVARLRVRPQGPALRPHRPPPQAARDRAAARPRVLDRGAAQLLLRHRDDLPRAEQEVREVGRVRPAPRPARQPRHPPPGHARGAGQEEPQVHQARDQEAEGLERRAPVRRGRGPGRQGRRQRRHRRGDRRGHPAVQRGGDRVEARRAARARHQRVQGPVHRQPERRRRTCATR